MFVVAKFLKTLKKSKRLLESQLDTSAMVLKRADGTSTVEVEDLTTGLKEEAAKARNHSMRIYMKMCDAILGHADVNGRLWNLTT
jgi:hypothetical protein